MPVYKKKQKKKKKKTGVLWLGARRPSDRPSVNILVHSITQQLLGISSCNFIGICIRSGRCVAHKTDCSLFLSFQVMPLVRAI